MKRLILFLLLIPSQAYSQLTVRAITRGDKQICVNGNCQIREVDTGLFSAMPFHASDTDTYFLSCAHPLSETTKGVQIESGGRRHNAQIVWKAVDIDMIVLQVRGLQVKTLPIATGSVARNTAISIYGRPGYSRPGRNTANRQCVLPGRVASLTSSSMWVAAGEAEWQYNTGMSGGPAVAMTREGKRIVGVMSGCNPGEAHLYLTSDPRLQQFIRRLPRKTQRRSLAPYSVPMPDYIDPNTRRTVRSGTAPRATHSEHVYVHTQSLSEGDILAEGPTQPYEFEPQPEPQIQQQRPAISQSRGNQSGPWICINGQRVPYQCPQQEVIVRQQPGRNGIDGKNGKDGRTPTKGELTKLIQQVIAANPERFRGRDGRNGTNGNDGKSVTAQQVASIIESVINDNPQRFRGENGANGASVSESQVAAMIQGVIDNNPQRFRGQNGTDGINGRDGEINQDALQQAVSVSVANQLKTYKQRDIVVPEPEELDRIIAAWVAANSARIDAYIDQRVRESTSGTATRETVLKEVMKKLESMPSPVTILNHDGSEYSRAPNRQLLDPIVINLAPPKKGE